MSSRQTGSASAIDVTGLRRSFGGGRHGPQVEVLRGIDLQVPAGSMTAIVGPSGCGKSTLLGCLSGLDRPQPGTVRTLGEDLGALRPAEVARMFRDQMGFVFQTSNLVGSLSALDNVLLPDRLAGRRLDRARAHAVLADLDVDHVARSRTLALSTGEQQRVALARVLLRRPELVFADEPTGALDSVVSGLVLDRLRRLADGDRTVVMVTHDLAAAARADLVLVMRDGRITATLTGATPTQLLTRLEAA